MNAAPIAVEGSAGVGIELSDKFEIRVLRHEVPWFGRYWSYLGPADLGPSGPYGDYATVGALVFRRIWPGATNVARYRCGAGEGAGS